MSLPTTDLCFSDLLVELKEVRPSKCSTLEKIARFATEETLHADLLTWYQVIEKGYDASDQCSIECAIEVLRITRNFCSDVRFVDWFFASDSALVTLLLSLLSKASTFPEMHEATDSELNAIRSGLQLLCNAAVHSIESVCDCVFWIHSIHRLLTHPKLTDPFLALVCRLLPADKCPFSVDTVVFALCTAEDNHCTRLSELAPLCATHLPLVVAKCVRNAATTDLFDDDSESLSQLRLASLLLEHLLAESKSESTDFGTLPFDLIIGKLNQLLDFLNSEISSVADFWTELCTVFERKKAGEECSDSRNSEWLVLITASFEALARCTSDLSSVMPLLTATLCALGKLLQGVHRLHPKGARVDSALFFVQKRVLDLRVPVTDFVAQQCSLFGDAQVSARKSGLIECVLSQTKIDDWSPFLPERSIICVRFFTQGCVENQEYIRKLKVATAKNPYGFKHDDVADYIHTKSASG